MPVYHLAIDIGASSGRHILGHNGEGKIVAEEVYRFSNGATERNGRLVWNAEALFSHIIAGMKRCKELNKIPVSVGIDTWGVDYALLDKNDRLIGDIVCYRDKRTEAVIPEVHEAVPQAELYRKTGIAFNSFNTVYQLFCDKTSGKLDGAETFLMLPDHFHFLLTGVKTNEYTNATTTGLLNAERGEWDVEIIEKLGFPKKLFKTPSAPGSAAGSLSKEIVGQTGFDCKVILPCTHDTASAVKVVDGEDALYISSGTWSLMGVLLDKAKTDEESRKLNYTNEGGYGKKYRYLKNIMGLWIIQSVRRELNDKYSFDDIVEHAKNADGFPSMIDVNDKRFFSPVNMTEEIRGYLSETNQPLPKSDGELFFCIYNSLAKSYAVTAKEIERLTGKTYGAIRIIGGGSKNTFLSELTEKATGKRIVSGPSEATAIGNLEVQSEFSA